MKIRWNHELAKDYIESIGYEYSEENSGKITSHKKIIIIKDNYFYYARIDVLKVGKLPETFAKSNPYTIQNIKLWYKLNNKEFELLNDKYESSLKKLTWKCLKSNCGEIFESSWGLIYSGSGCPYCSIPSKKVGLSNCLITKNPELAKEWHPTKNGSLTPYDVTCGSNKNVWWQCEKGHEWESTIDNRIRKETSCPFCIGKKATKERNLLIINPKLCEEWDYNKNKKLPEHFLSNSNKKVWWICKECGHEWEAVILNRTYGNGCPKCNESKGEKKIDFVLTKYNISHDSQFTFNDLVGIGGGLLKFDVPVFWDEEKTRLRMLIEFDGIFHYEKQYDNDGFETIQIHDKLKNEYCIKNNIILVRIPYWEFDNIEEILAKELKLEFKKVC